MFSLEIGSGSKVSERKCKTLTPALAGISVKTLSRSIDFQGNCISESTIYFSVIIRNNEILIFLFLMNQIFKKKLLYLEKDWAYSRLYSSKFQNRSQYGDLKLNGLHRDNSPVWAKAIFDNVGIDIKLNWPWGLKIINSEKLSDFWKCFRKPKKAQNLSKDQIRPNLEFKKKN